MKIVCDCGNEMDFNLIDEETGKVREESEFGIYADKDFSKFDFWAEHDQTGLTCKKCNKSIWYWA